MNELYQGEMKVEHVQNAIDELDMIMDELKQLPPSAVVWDFEDKEKTPPWGDNISDDITDLSNYFVTGDGSDFLTIFHHALEKSIEMREPITIRSI